MPVLIHIPKHFANDRSVDVTALDRVNKRARNKNARRQPGLRIFQTFGCGVGGGRSFELGRKNSLAAGRALARRVLQRGQLELNAGTSCPDPAAGLSR